MSFISEDHSRRLERARRQYENLLIHAGEVLIEKEPGLNETFASEEAMSPQRMRDVRFQSPAARSVSKPRLDDSFDQDGTMDKDSIIFSLQEEVDRLRNKLESVVSSVEAVIQDAQKAQDEIRNEHEQQLNELLRRYARLEDENNQLKVTLDLSQAQLAVEQDNLLKAAKFIERLKRRGREYVGVQRKSHGLLVTTSALCTATSAAAATQSKVKRASSASGAAASASATVARDSGNDYAGSAEDAANGRNMRSERQAPIHMYPASAMKSLSGGGSVRR